MPCADLSRKCLYITAIVLALLSVVAFLARPQLAQLLLVGSPADAHDVLAGSASGAAVTPSTSVKSRNDMGSDSLHPSAGVPSNSSKASNLEVSSQRTSEGEVDKSGDSPSASPVSSESGAWPRADSAFPSMSGASAFAILCCNWNSKHKGEGFWASRFGANGPVSALMQQLQRLEDCSWMKTDAKLKVIVFYQRPPEAVTGLTDALLASLPGLAGKLQVIDITDSFLAPPEFVGNWDHFLDCKRNALLKRRGKSTHFCMGLGYRIANDFWSNKVFSLPAVKNLEFLLRLDEDSILKCSKENAFDVMRRGGFAYGYYKLLLDNEFVTRGFGGTFLQYVKQNKNTQPLWSLDHDGEAWRRGPTYYNDFEIMHMPRFVGNAKIRHLTDHIVNSKGIFQWRWADGMVRFLQVAFAFPTHEVKCFLPHELDYDHQHEVPDPKFCSICMGKHLIGGFMAGALSGAWCSKEVPSGPWVKIFQHDTYRAARKYATKDNFLSIDPHNNNSGLYSQLGELEKYFTSGREFIFKLSWPGSPFKDQIWAQESNPATSSIVKGYRALSTPHSTQNWAGLMLCTKQNSQLPHVCNIKGDKSKGFWYAIAMTQPFGGGYPGPDMNPRSPNGACRIVQLFVLDLRAGHHA